MCFKLLQVYACIHTKAICKTPCPHALDTGRKVPLDNAFSNDLSRSNSAVSSLAPSTSHGSQSSRFHSPPASPLSPTSARPSPLGPPAGYPGHSPTSLSPSLPNEKFTIEPNYCPYHFPRYLPQSHRPCIECYTKPEWADLATRWMKQYRQDHPMEKVEEVEQSSGVEGLKEKEREKRRREGLLNVFVDGDEAAGRVG